MRRDRDYCRIYIGNLPPNVRQKDLEEVFSPYGKIISIEIKGRKRKARGRQVFGFVGFDDARDAEAAVRSCNGYEFDGYCLRVEFTRESGSKGAGGGISRRCGGYRLAVSGLPPSGSWQNLKDHFRSAGDVVFADVFRDGTGVVEFKRCVDMRFALKKLDDTKFKSHKGETSYIRVKEDRHSRRLRSPMSRSPTPRRTWSDSDRSPLYSQSRSRSRSRSRTSSRSCSPLYHAPSFPVYLPVVQPQQPLKLQSTTNSLEVGSYTKCKIRQNATKLVSSSLHPTKINTFADLLTYVTEQGHEQIRDAEKLTFNEVVQRQTGLIGAKMLYQIICHDHPELETYYCSMCDHWTIAWKIFQHLNSTHHKLAYMQRHYKTMYNKAMATPDDGSRKKFIDSTSELIFKQEGSGRCENRMKTILNIGTFERLWPDYENSIDNSWKLMGENEMSEEFFLSTPIKTYNAPLSARTDVAALQLVNRLPITCKSPISQGLIDPNGRLIDNDQRRQNDLSAYNRSLEQMRHSEQPEMRGVKSHALCLQAEEIGDDDWSS